MTTKDLLDVISGHVLEDDVELTLSELCRACRMSAERVVELVDEGVIEPLGRDPARWRFPAPSLRRVRCVVHLQRDLGVNLAGAALAVDLLEEIEQLRRRLQCLQDR